MGHIDGFLKKSENRDFLVVRFRVFYWRIWLKFYTELLQRLKRPPVKIQLIPPVKSHFLGQVKIAILGFSGSSPGFWPKLKIAKSSRFLCRFRLFMPEIEFSGRFQVFYVDLEVFLKNLKFGLLQWIQTQKPARRVVCRFWHTKSAKMGFSKPRST